MLAGFPVHLEKIKHLLFQTNSFSLTGLVVELKKGTLVKPKVLTAIFLVFRIQYTLKCHRKKVSMNCSMANIFRALVKCAFLFLFSLYIGKKLRV